MKENRNTYQVLRTFRLILLTSLIGLHSQIQVKGGDLINRYRGSTQEQALDAQVKSYRPNAIKNRQVFGGLTTKRHSYKFCSPEWSREKINSRKKNKSKKGNSYDNANRRKTENEIGSR